jgi:hypothetical protein
MFLNYYDTITVGYYIKVQIINKSEIILEIVTTIRLY